MNNYLTVFLILLLVVILFFLIRALVPSLKHIMTRIPKWAVLVVIAVVITAIIILINSLITSGGAYQGAGTGNESKETEASQNEKDIIENCIILNADIILIEGRIVDMAYVDSYLTSKAGTNTEITLVDNYAISTLYHEVERLCLDKGVIYHQEDETWLK